MQFVVIEHFRQGDARPVYARFAAQGRLLPEGVSYVASWISADLTHCYQVMEADDVALLQRWTAAWSDLVEFEIIPVISSEEAAEAMTRSQK